MVNVTELTSGVTKLGGHQKRIRWLIGHEGALTWRQLLEKTELDERLLSQSLRALVAAGVLEHKWNRRGVAVYRLPERKDDVSER
jgi:DNA-binding HxlR family transcriptional regulator